MTKITIKFTVKTEIDGTSFSFSPTSIINGDKKEHPDEVTKKEVEHRIEKILKILDAEMGEDWQDPSFQSRMDDF